MSHVTPYAAYPSHTDYYRCVTGIISTVHLIYGKILYNNCYTLLYMVYANYTWSHPDRCDWPCKIPLCPCANFDPFHCFLKVTWPHFNAGNWYLMKLTQFYSYLCEAKYANMLSFAESVAHTQAWFINSNTQMFNFLH